MRRTIITLVLAYIILFSQDLTPPKNDLFEELTEYSNYEITPDSIVIQAKYIVSLLDDSEKYDDTQFYMKEIDGQNFIVSSKTYLYSKICEKSCSDLGALTFTEYLLKYIDSCEEKLSFSFERIFNKNPEVVLDFITGLDDKNKSMAYEHIAWGFLNNLSCGIENPYENVDNKAMIVFYDTLEVVLNLTNYEEMFYNLNPTLPALKQTYQKDFYQILKKIQQMLQWQEDYKIKNK